MQVHTITRKIVEWGMNTAVRLAASHRDDLRCDHFNSSRSSRRQVKYSILHKRPAIVHSNFYRFAIAWVADDKAGAQWESSVSSGKPVRIELFSRGRPVPPKLIAIPRSRYSIFSVRTRSQSDEDKKDEDAKVHWDALLAVRRERREWDFVQYPPGECGIFKARARSAGSPNAALCAELNTVGVRLVKTTLHLRGHAKAYLASGSTILRTIVW